MARGTTGGFGAAPSTLKSGYSRSALAPGRRSRRGPLVAIFCDVLARSGLNYRLFRIVGEAVHGQSQRVTDRECFGLSNMLCAGSRPPRLGVSAKVGHRGLSPREPHTTRKIAQAVANLGRRVVGPGDAVQPGPAPPPAPLRRSHRPWSTRRRSWWRRCSTSTGSRSWGI